MYGVFGDRDKIVSVSHFDEAQLKSRNKLKNVIFR